MRKINYELLTNSLLFRDIPQNQVNDLITKLNTRATIYEPNSYIFHRGDYLEDIGIVYQGKALLCKNDSNGNMSIINSFEKYDIFAEVLVINNQPLPYDLIASGETIIVYINYQKITQQTDNPFQSILIKNFMALLADKVNNLNIRMQILTERKTRDKLLTYLQLQPVEKGIITISYNREQLANYLSVDRSALSAVLMQLREEGILDYYKNTFKFLKKKK